MRYLVEYIDPTTGETRMGTDTKLVRHYANDVNASRTMHVHLRWGRFPVGQYRLIAWPVGQPEREVGYLYKRA